jgi:hypothetical protein
MLDRPKGTARHLSRECRSYQAVLTPELTRAERTAHEIMEQDNDESHAAEASG